MLPVDLREIKIAGDVHIRNSAVVAKFVDLLLHCSDEVFEFSCRGVRWAIYCSDYGVL